MNVGEQIELSKGTFNIEPCKHCKKPMVNLDSDEIGLGDMVKMKLAGVLISNPETDELVCIHCDIITRPSKRKALSDWYSSPSNDDSSWHSSGTFSMPSFGGSDFGGFGGGSFGGGGASGGF